MSYQEFVFIRFIRGFFLKRYEVLLKVYIIGVVLKSRLVLIN